MIKGAGIIAIVNDKVLLVKAGAESLQADGSISFPGGHIEDGESEQETALREFTEETGLLAGDLIDFSGNYVEALVPRKTGDEKASFKVFLTQSVSGALRITDETEPIWVAVDEARKLKLYGKNNHILDSALIFLKKI